MAGAALDARAAEQPATGRSSGGKPAVRFGLLTDVHYADKPSAGTRHYRDSLAKIRESIARFNEVRADFIIELGDFIDAADTADVEAGYLKTIDAEFARFTGDRHYVLGNHCVWTLTKEEFFANSVADKAHYSFDKGGFHFVVLDACYRGDGVSYGRRNYDWTDCDVPPAQQEWLKADLAQTSKTTIVFVHQRLDVAGHYGIKSGPAVRDILERSGKVLTVFQGHNHINDFKEIGGIHYLTFAAMIEGPAASANAYAIAEILEDGSIRVDGFGQQKDYSLRRL